jgi:flagellar biosynthesis protein FliQ
MYTKEYCIFITKICQWNLHILYVNNIMYDTKCNVHICFALFEIQMLSAYHHHTVSYIPKLLILKIIIVFFYEYQLPNLQISEMDMFSRE